MGGWKKHDFVKNCWLTFSSMNLLYSVEIDFMESFSLPVLEPKSSFFKRVDPWTFKSLSQVGLSLSLTITTVGLFLVITKSTSQKTARPFNIMILKGCITVSTQPGWSNEPWELDFHFYWPSLLDLLNHKSKVRPKKQQVPSTLWFWRDAI